jgi:predicted nucleic acid-binding protein
MAKATGKVPVYYFDSCVFLSLINETAGRFKIIEVILDNSERHECEVYTSQITITEVAFAEQEKKGKALSAATEKKIDKLWHPTSPVKLIDVHSALSIGARLVIRQAMKQGWTKGEDWVIKPFDAMHVATAQAVKADYLFTYDARLLKLIKAHVGIEIKEPFLRQGIIGVAT